MISHSATVQSMPLSAKVLVYYLTFVAVYFLTGFFNLIPIQFIKAHIGLKAQTIVVLVSVIFVLGSRYQLRGILSFPFLTNLLLFLGLVLISIVVGVLTLGEKFFEVQRQSPSYFSIFYFLIVFALILLIVKVHQTAADLRNFMLVWLAISAVVVLVARVTSLGINWYDLPGFYQSQERESGLMSMSVTEIRGRYLLRESFLWLDTNTYGNLVALGILLGLYFLVDGGNKWWTVLIYLYITIAGSSLLATLSRSSIVQLTVGFVIFGFLVRKGGGIAKKILLLLILLVTVGLTIYYSSQDTLDVFVYRILIATDFFSVGPTREAVDGAAMSRYMTAALAWKYFLSHPLFGSGGIQYATLGVTSNHSEILNYLSQFGFLAWAALVSLLVGIPLKLLRIRRELSHADALMRLNALLVAMNAVCAVRIFTDPLFYTYFVVLALSIAFIKATRNERRHQAEHSINS